MKKLFLVVILFLGIAVVVISFSELETIMLTLQKAHLTFFILAIIVQLIWFVTTARTVSYTHLTLPTSDLV